MRRLSLARARRVPVRDPVGVRTTTTPGPAGTQAERARAAKPATGLHRIGKREPQSAPAGRPAGRLITDREHTEPTILVVVTRDERAPIDVIAAHRNRDQDDEPHDVSEDRQQHRCGLTGHAYHATRSRGSGQRLTRRRVAA